MDAQVVNERQLQRLFLELPRRVAKKTMRQAISAGATPMAKAVRQRAGAVKESGLLKKSIGRKVKSYASGTTVAMIGARSKFAGEYMGRRRVPAKYLHLVERGTKPHGNHPGTPARHVLKAGFEQSSSAAASAAKSKLAQGVIREARQLGKM